MSTSGSDSAAGSQSAPWRTLNKAATAVAAGDTVNVAPGTYDERAYLRVAGTSAAPVKFVAQTGGKVLVTKGFYVKADYNTVEGFEVSPGTGLGNGSRNADNTYADGAIQLSGANDVARNNYVHDLTDAAPWAILTTGANNVLEGNRIHNPYRGHISASGTGVVIRNNRADIDPAFLNAKPTNWKGIHLGINGTSGMLVEGNYFKGPGDGNMIHVPAAVSNVTFRANTIVLPGRKTSSTTHTQTFGFYKSATNVTFDGNIIGTADPMPSGYVAGFTHFFFGTTDATGVFTNLKFTNNVFLGVLDGAYYIQFKAGDTLSGLRFDNNVVDIPSGWRLADVSSGVVASNNIVMRGSIGGTRDYNLYPTTKASGEGSHTRVGSPMFVNPDKSSATAYGVNADWNLKAGSPAIDAGTSAGTPTKDRLGRARVDDAGTSNVGGGTPNYFDIGAMEKTSATTTTTTPSTTPTTTTTTTTTPSTTPTTTTTTPSTTPTTTTTTPTTSGPALYVSTTGADTNAGTLSAPVKTIAKAITLAKAGTTVYLRGGTYAERPVFNGAGTSSSPITFQSYSGEKAIISRGFQVSGTYNVIRDITVTPGDTSATTAADGQIVVTGNYNTLDRIAQYDSSWVSADVAALTFKGAHNTAKDIDFHHTGAIRFIGRGAGLAAGTGEYNTVNGGSIRYTRDKNVLIEADHSTLQNLDTQYPGQRNAGDSADGIALNGNFITLRGCTVRNVYETRPIAEQHPDAIIWWNDGNDLVIEDCIIGSAGTSTYAGTKVYDQGHLMWSSKRSGKTSNRVIIRNNLFLGTEGTYALNGSTGNIAGQMSGWRVVGNTFASGKNPATGANGNMIRGASFAEIGSWTITDNYFAGRGMDVTTIPSGSVLDYNAHSNYAPYSGSAHSFRTDAPGFVKPDFSSTTEYGVKGDWHVPTTSPLVGKGVASSYLTDDRDGKTRVTPPTVGAYEGGAGTTTTPTVTPVTGLMSVNSGAQYATSTSVAVNSTVTGATEMRVDTGAGFSAWMPYAATQAVTLPAGDGTKTVKCEYRNASGGSLVLSDTIVLDATAPTGTMVLNHGKTTTAVTKIDVGSNVTGATQMRLNNGSGWSAWTTYTSLTTVTLTSGDGKKTVTAEYRDAAGNVLSIWHTVTLDTTP